MNSTENTSGKQTSEYNMTNKGMIFAVVLTLVESFSGGQTSELGELVKQLHDSVGGSPTMGPILFIIVIGYYVASRTFLKMKTPTKVDLDMDELVGKLKEHMDKVKKDAE